MVASVEIKSKEFIKPSSPTAQDSKDHKLSFLDQLVMPTYIPLIFVYQNQSCSVHLSNRLQHLKQSLADALTKFNHLAGRLKGSVSIDCNDSGALFVEAQVHASLLQAMENPPTHELNQYLPLEPYAAMTGAISSDDAPLLAIQVSFFQCGGIAIGVCLSHMTGDMASLMMFMNSWATLCRGERIDGLLAQISFDLARQLFPQVDTDSNFPMFANNVRKEKIVCRRFLFDKEKLAALKELASTDDFFGLQVKNPTRVESISAFIWKEFIDICRAKDDTKSLFLANHSVDLRTRMNSLHSDQIKRLKYMFGNLAITSHALSILSWRSGNSYQELVRIFRTTFRKINNDFIKIVQSGIPYLEHIKRGSRQLPDPQEIHFSSFTSWCRFPFYGVDYGWGKPLSVCTSAVPCKNTAIFMDTRCGDGIEAWITMSEDEMTMLPDELLSLETTTYY